MKKLEIYLQALQAGQHERRIILKTIEELKSCTPQELSEYRLLVAALYCQLLQYCQSMYKGNVPQDIVEELLQTFESIEQIGVEATEKERYDSNLTTVWFLHELKTHGKVGDVWKIEDELLQKSIQILIQELDNIYFVFDIKEDEQYVFPIHNMIAKVVERPEFVDINNPLGIYQIHILQLAVRLFINCEDKQKILQTLIDQCNLRFIKYLNASGYIIDTMDLLNYQKNGVMIFYDAMTNKVLVRNKSRNYFEGKPLWEIGGVTIEEEKDHHRNKIGFFVEYDLEKSDSLKDHSDILKSEDGRQAFLRLVFDKKAYNILFEHSIIKKADGSLLPVNPYCYNDNKIVKGWLKSKTGTIYEKEHLIDAIREYRSSALKVCKECVMNRVTFGLAIMLLQNENVGVNGLGVDELNSSEWYQSQVLKNWVEHCSDSIEALTFVAGQWQRENEYCVITYKKNKNSKEKNIEEHEIEPLDFYPLKSDNSWMYQIIIGCKNPTGWYVLHGKVQEDSEGKFILVVDLVSDVVGKKFSQDTEMTQLLIDTEFLDDPEGLIEEIWGSGDEYYLLYNNKKQSGVVCNQTLLKMLSALEKTQSKNYLTLETASEISWTQYDEITDMMLLQGAALEEVGKRYFCDFDSQVYYRLIHNLLWSEIDKAKMGSYLKIFMHHQKLKFSEINRDEKFMRKDVNTLYVPKDGRESDSVLTSIYETYLKAKSVRESNDMYNYMLELKEDGFYYNDNRINNIVFLCDNFECGSATIRMLKAYLNLDVTDESEKRKVEQVRANRQKYFIKQNGSDVAPEQRDEVPLESVIKKNNCTIEIHGYYGTEIGKKAVEDFLNEQHINSGVVSYERQITKQATQIINEVKEIWPRFAPKENVYTVVREFNMPKMNVFPVTMLNDPKRAICMFVKKDEIKKNQK